MREEGLDRMKQRRETDEQMNRPEVGVCCISLDYEQKFLFSFIC